LFQHIGRPLDDDAPRRTATSALLLSVVSTAAAGFVFGIAAYKTVEDSFDTGEPESQLELVAVDLAEERIEEALPAPPVAALPPPSESEPTDEEVQPTPDEMQEVKPLDDVVKREVATTVRPQGHPDGLPGGDPNGHPDGTPGGDPNGRPDGQFGGGAQVFHHSELEVKRRFEPRYPEAAKALNLGTQRCKVIVDIDEQGVPLAADVRDCPRVFHEATRQAVLKWRWYAPRAGKRKVRGRTTLVFSYKLR
jgi:outer membrane biosynthesis protein TonB